MQNNIQVLPNTIFVFDLHGVIFKLQPFKVVKELIKCPYKLKLFSLLFYPKVFLQTISQLRNGAIAEEILLKLGNLFPQYKELLPTGFNIINAQTPINETVNVIKKLKLKGYKLFILSNIGELSIDIMQKQFPEIFKDFDGILASSAQDNYIKKPSALAFEKYLNKFNQDRSNVIFVDDRIININAAQSINIPSILFTNPKQFHNKLIDLKAF